MTYDLIFLEPDSPDPTLLFLHVFSVFHEEIQSFGQENRMRLLDTLKSVLYDYIPAFTRSITSIIPTHWTKSTIW